MEAAAGPLSSALRVSVIQFERAPKSRIARDWWLFWRLGLTSRPHPAGRTKARKDGYWGETISVNDIELAEAEETDSLKILLFAWGRIKSELVGVPLILTMSNIMALLGGSQANGPREFWFNVKNSKQEVEGQVRLAFEFAEPNIRKRMFDLILHQDYIDSTVATTAIFSEQALENLADNDELDYDESEASMVVTTDLTASKVYLSSASGYAAAYTQPAEGEEQPLNYAPVLGNNDEPVSPSLDDDDTFEFNKLWQREMKRLVADDEPNLSIIADLSRAFLDQAETYAKVIVSERHLPLEKKSIKPSAVGGILGGEKFVVNGLLFKMSVDVFSIGSERAAKIAGLELKSATALFNALQVLREPIGLPFVAIFDFMGCRVLALNILPINSFTLVHGSSDGGRTIRNDPEGERVMQKVATFLNLRSHEVRGVPIPLAVDVELHRSRGQLYFVDLSRLFPPETPRSDLNLKFPHLYRVLRAEHVRHNAQPLVADAYSGFIDPKDENRDLFHADVLKATKKLRSFSMPWAALLIDQLFASHAERHSFFSLEYFRRIRFVIHSIGVNMRYLGTVFRRCSVTISKQLLLLEMCGRIVKTKLRAIMREQTLGASAWLRTTQKTLVAELNEIFTRRNVEKWDEIAVALQDYFGNLDLRPVSGSVLMSEISEIPNAWALLIQRTAQMSGLEFSDRADRIIERWMADDAPDSMRKQRSQRRLSISRESTLRYIGRVLPEGSPE